MLFGCMVLDWGTPPGWGSLPDLSVLEVGSSGPGPAVVGDGEGEELKGREVEDGKTCSEVVMISVTDADRVEPEVGDVKTGSLVTGSEVAMTLSPTAVTVADVGDDEVEKLEGQEVEDGKAGSEVAMTLSSTLVTDADRVEL